MEGCLACRLTLACEGVLSPHTAEGSLAEQGLNLFALLGMSPHQGDGVWGCLAPRQSPAGNTGSVLMPALTQVIIPSQVKEADPWALLALSTTLPVVQNPRTPACLSVLD